MKTRFALLCLLLFSGTFSFSQTSAKKVKPFIIQAQLKNFNDGQLMLSFINAKGERIQEFADLDKQGKFHLSTTKIIKPILVTLQSDKNSYGYLYAAPGYNLTITANCEDRKTFTLTKQIEGKGLKASKYLFKTDSTRIADNDNVDEYKISLTNYLARLNRSTRKKDSIWTAIYGKTRLKDPYDEALKNRIRSNIDFEKLDALTWHLVGDTTLNYQQTINFVKANTNQNILNDLYNKKNLTSESYLIMMNDGYYAYLKSLQKKHGFKFDDKAYRADNIKIIAQNYKGDIRQKTLYTQMRDGIRYVRSFEELNISKNAFALYIPQLVKQSQKDEITNLIKEKEIELLKTQIGKPAPAFTANDESGKPFNLSDFKGKVVLLDLWASWCEPCRALTPQLKKLVQQYSAQNNIAFVSVAVLDKTEDWKKAMAQDKPTWLQLFDTKGMVQSAYVANSIPKLIVIDKKGNIVTFDAPESSPLTELKNILDNEIAKM